LLPDNKALEKQLTTILRLGHKCFLDVDFDNNGNPTVSTMSELIKAYSKEKQGRLNGEDITAVEREENITNNQIYDHNKIQAEFPPPLQPEIPPPLAKDTQVQGGDFPIQQDTDLDEILEGDLQQQVSTQPRRNVGMYKDWPAEIRRLPIDGKEYELAFNVDVISDWEKPLPAISNTRYITKDFHPNQKFQKGFLAECYLLQDTWFDDPTCVSELLDHLKMDTWDRNRIYFNDIVNSRILKAHKSTKVNEDNSLFGTSTWGLF
jgi:hypothetical protein